MRRAEKEEASKSLWDSLFSDPNECFQNLIDPNKKDRDDHQQLKKEIKASKKCWRKIRAERFSFLDTNEFESTN